MKGDDRDFKEEFGLYQEKINNLELLRNYSVSQMKILTKKQRMDYWLDRCPIHWWRENQTSFPIMSQSVLILLDLRVSTASSERNHSSTRLLINPQRSTLSPQLIRMIRFIQQNLRFFYPYLFD